AVRGLVVSRSVMMPPMVLVGGGIVVVSAKAVRAFTGSNRRALWRIHLLPGEYARLRPVADVAEGSDGYLASVMQQPRMITGRQRMVLGVLALVLCEVITVGGTIAAAQHQPHKVDLDAFAIVLPAVPPLTVPLRLRHPREGLA